MKKKKADRLFLITVFTLIAIGFFIFVSASLGLVSRDGGARFQNVSLKQLLILLMGCLGMIITSNVDFKKYQRLAFWIYLFSIGFTLLVFMPKIGFGAGGAKRWLRLGILTFQPSEVLKFGYVTYLAYWLTSVKDRVQTFSHGLLPFLIITSIAGAILVKEPDLGTLMTLLAAGFTVFVVGGARWSHILLLLVMTCVGVLGIAEFSPYVKSRLTTFINPVSDTLGSSYQINQSLIAIGSGGISGRGFGQSIQKFNYLPEQIGDSIFAVASEEFGFIGSSTLIMIFALLAILGLKIAAKTPDNFGRLMVTGLVILIVAQAFINIAAMMGLIPLTGVPLTFVSQGGSALIIAMLEIGIILNISKHKKTQAL